MSANITREWLLADLGHWNLEALDNDSRLTSQQVTSLANNLLMRGWRRVDSDECPDCKRNVTGLCGVHCPPPYEVGPIPEPVESERLEAALRGWFLEFAARNRPAAGFIPSTKEVSQIAAHLTAAGFVHRDGLIEKVVEVIAEYYKEVKDDPTWHVSASKYLEAIKAEVEKQTKDLRTRLEAYRDVVKNHRMGCSTIERLLCDHILTAFDRINNLPLDHNVNKPLEWQIGNGES